jgi:hypothetical protein
LKNSLNKSILLCTKQPLYAGVSYIIPPYIGVIFYLEKEKMNKLSFKLPKKIENIETEFLGQKIEICPVIGITEQITMIGNYLTNYFNSKSEESFGRYNFIEADLLLKVELIEIMTSIDIEKNFDIGLVEAYGIMGLLEEYILNLDEFYNRLEETVSIIESEKESEKAVGSVIDGLSKKVLDVLGGLSESISKFDVSDVEKIKSGVSDILKQVDGSPVSKYLKESKVE